MGENAGVILTIKDWVQGNRQKIIIILFAVLFVTRLINGYLSLSFQNDISPFGQYFFFIVSIPLTTAMIWICKSNLYSLNIDKYSLYTVVLSSILLFFIFGFSLIGVVALICAIIAGRVSNSQNFDYPIQRNFSRVIFYTALGVIPVILSRFFVPESYRVHNFYLELSVGTIFVVVSILLWGVVVEESLFRGILWGLLSDQKFSTRKTVFIQAVLFWLVHLDLIAQPSFGLNVLAFGLWVGFLVLRSKSLMPSIAAHLVHNLTSDLL